MVMVPDNDALEQPPVVVTVYGNVPATVGVPDIVKMPAAKLPLTPEGKLVTVAPVAPSATE